MAAARGNRGQENFEPIPIQTVTSNKGTHIFFEEYQFNKKQSRNGRDYWYCKHFWSSSKCKMSLVVHDGEITKISGQHNHDLDFVAMFVKNKMEQCIQQNIVTNTPPRDVYKLLVDEILNSTAGKVGVSYLPGTDKFGRILNRNRAVHSDLPPQPKGWKDLVDIPEVFKTLPDGGEFCIMNEAMDPTDEDSARIIGFASRDCLGVLQHSNETLADGTFSVCNGNLFYQLYVFFVSLENGESVPVAYYLLPGKNGAMYKRIFENLKSKLLHNIPRLIIDWEKAAAKAAEATFEGIEISFCGVHFYRNLVKNAEKCGLATEVRDREDLTFSIFLRRLASITLVPPDDMIKVFNEHIMTKIPWKDAVVEDPADEEDRISYNDSLRKFATYYEKLVIGKRIGDDLSVRGSPQFPHSAVSKYADVVNDQSTTTNKAEAWNHSFGASMRSRTSTWELFRCIRLEEGLTVAKIQRSNRGEQPINYNTSAYKKNRERKEELRAIVSAYHDYADKGNYIVDILKHYNYVV